MKAVLPKEMNEIDRLTINKIGIPGIVLMENAALAVVEELIRDRKEVRGKNILLLAGKGNNGGDAFAVARHLFNKGACVRTYLLCKTDEIKGDARINLNALQKMGLYLEELESQASMKEFIHAAGMADAIVDGIFGTGIKGTVGGIPREVIEIINQSGKYIISIDIPSGICGQTGQVLGISVKADKTVTFALPKTGLLIHPGCEYVGELIVSDIGIPKSVVDELDIKTHFIDRELSASFIPKRLKNSNKGDYGKVFAVTGSVGMTGAGCLTAEAVLRSGAGLVYLGVPSSLSHIYDILLAESVTVPLTDDGKGVLSKTCIQKVLEMTKKADAVAVGPGLSLGGESVEVVQAVIRESQTPLVLDADALNAVSKDVSILNHLKAKAVITPHPGEMARLLSISSQEVQYNRIELARDFSRKFGIITVLKGAKTLVALPDGTLFINPTGNSGMSTAGTGDVLTGIIAGLIAQGTQPEAAAVLGVYLHGLAGDLAAKDKGEYGLIARDVVHQLPYAIKLLE